MWGQEKHNDIFIKCLRIIPTRVGTRHPIGYLRTAEKDHPHACGDKDILKILISITEGSSPRVWGQEKKYCELYLNDRIIPTRVGTRCPSRTKNPQKSDHPHACGDKVYAVSYTAYGKISSPRVWGQGDSLRQLSAAARIIPTRVGTRYSILATFKAYRDHPHACGDKCYRWQACRYKSGSSPRVWGQVLQFMRRSCLSRIIPTRVGTSHSDTR